MTSPRIRTWLLGALGASLIGMMGCSDAESPPTSGAAPGAPAKSAKPRHAPAGADMVTAVSAGKPGAPVQVKFDLAKRPEVGQPLEVDVLVTAVAPLAGLYVSFQGGEGLELRAGREIARIEDVKAGASFSHKVTLVPKQDGVFYLSAVALADGTGGGSLARTFSIPVIVGEGVAELSSDKPRAPVQTDATGEKVISMPAKETTRSP